MGTDSGQTNNRRRFLAALGTAAIGSLAGCSGDNLNGQTGNGGESTGNGGGNGVNNSEPPIDNGGENGGVNETEPPMNGVENGGSNETESPTDNGGGDGMNETEPGNGNGQDESGGNGGEDLGEMLNQLETESHNVLEENLDLAIDDRIRVRLSQPLDKIADMIGEEYNLLEVEKISEGVSEEYKSFFNQGNVFGHILGNFKQSSEEIKRSKGIFPPSSHETVNGQWTGELNGVYGFVNDNDNLIISANERSLLEDYVDLYDGEIESLLDSMDFEGLELEGVVTSFSVNRPDEGSIIPEVDMSGLLEGYGGDYERFVNYFYVDPDNLEKLLEDGDICEVTKGYRDGEWEIIDDYSRGFDAEFYFDELN